MTGSADKHKQNNIQKQIFGFRERFCKLQRLKFHIKQVNYNLCWTIFTCRLASLPEKPAPINWTYYRSVVAKAGMVDEFEKKVRSSDFSVSLFFFLSVCLIATFFLPVSHSTVRWIDGPWASGHSDSKDRCPGAGGRESLLILHSLSYS